MSAAGACAAFDWYSFGPPSTAAAASPSAAAASSGTRARGKGITWIIGWAPAWFGMEPSCARRLAFGCEAFHTGQWDVEGEARASTWSGRLGPDTAAVRLDDAPTDCQADTGALDALVGRAVDATEL